MKTLKKFGYFCLLIKKPPKKLEEDLIMYFVQPMFVKTQTGNFKQLTNMNQIPNKLLLFSYSFISISSKSSNRI
jgi:hypothetical protein